jgi:DNA polymerase-4
MDAFFAAVEQRDNPDLRGKPVIVGGDPARRGVVAAASYEARRYGIRSAMPSAEAQRRCPHAVFITPHGRRYGEVSRQVMAVLESYTPLVEQVSVDEAFLDVTGCERLFGPAQEIARQIQQRLQEELGLSASIGVAPNRFLAKLASDRDKPGGLVVVRPEQVEEFLRDLPLEAVWGVGEVTADRLRRLGLRTVGQLATYPLDLLEQQFGEYGRRLHELAHGVDESPLTLGVERKQVSAETTFERDTTDREFLESQLLRLSEQVGARLRRKGLAGTTVTLKVRFSDFRTITRRDTSPAPVSEDLALYQRARALLAPQLAAGRKIRLLGVGVSNFAAACQPSLFGPERAERPVDAAVDQVRDRFGEAALRRGRFVTKTLPSRAGNEESA